MRLVHKCSRERSSICEIRLHAGKHIVLTETLSGSEYKVRAPSGSEYITKEP